MTDGQVLLVEDDQDDVDLTVRALEKHRIATETVVVRDGVEALDYLFGTGSHVGRNARNTPRLVLLDLQLPKLDGHEVLRRLRADPLTRLLPVVVLTSSTEAYDLEQSYRLGANSYIQKPVDFTRFVEAVGLLSRYWLRLNEPPPAARGG